jgi:hypothetical protein
MKKRYVALIVLIALVTGFFIGRNRIEYRETVRWGKGDVIRDTVEVPAEPSFTERPNIDDVKLPMRVDTLWMSDTIKIVERVDSAKIIADYIAINYYNLLLFDNDTLGRFEINQSIQFNRLRHLDFSFEPLIKERTIYERPRFEPFVSGSINTFNTVGFGGGVFIRDVGVEYQFQRNYLNDRSGHQISLKYRF